ncbi:MAG TPA: hypothetical protein ENI31_04700 [Candidatus Omnitrophica bacterium]|nr:MAG: hypothetical protein DRP69_04815 [Candidatus Omnitrophota bacterium]RKY42825.1 MAG: hypothetical protein DRP80_06300 [Candidatus Omnitrophota bacterium]HEC69562.1 hypothetical protein [Candidatus Omnitrophota bacterium]
MSTKFLIKRIYKIGELLALAGEVKSGVIKEGDTGTTWENKRFTVVKIETKDGSIPTASSSQEVTLIVKGILRKDLASGDTLYIE